MKKILFCIINIFIMFYTSCKELQKTMQQEFDYYIENEDYIGIKKLKGRYFTYENTRIDNTSLDTYPIFLEENFNNEKFYRNAAVEIYENKSNPEFIVFFLTYNISPRGKKPKGYKGADTQINEIALLKCKKGYRFISFPACKYNEKKEIVLAGSVLCLRKAKVLEDGTLENITVWNEIKTPDYVIEIQNPENFIISKGEDSEYFYYYDENHY
ncbi:MAG: hypothetical protein K6A15_06495 [Treponema sp.]|nr:hypothetical protein [Treponema sp.]